MKIRGISTDTYDSFVKSLKKATQDNLKALWVFIEKKDTQVI